MKKVQDKRPSPRKVNRKMEMKERSGEAHF